MPLISSLTKVNTLPQNIDSTINPIYPQEEGLNETKNKIKSPKTRGFRNKPDQEHSFWNPNQTQANCFPKCDDITLQKPPNSYSPNKNLVMRN